eukprot:9598972-Prorocentrum_lima.AAC.1
MKRRNGNLTELSLCQALSVSALMAATQLVSSVPCRNWSESFLQSENTLIWRGLWQEMGGSQI